MSTLSERLVDLADEAIEELELSRYTADHVVCAVLRELASVNELDLTPGYLEDLATEIEENL